MHLINFNDFDHNFCESTIYSSDPYPEYLNSISSLFITFIGPGKMRLIQSCFTEDLVEKFLHKLKSYIIK